MRLLLAIAAGLLAAQGAVAQTVQDRYGPPRSDAAASAAYGGNVLRWAGKRDATPPAAAPPSAPRPQALELAARYDPAVRQPRPEALLRPAPAPSPSAATFAPPPATQPARQAGAATKLYSLHREYGLSPDAIPEPPTAPRYVLLGPPEGEPPPASAPADPAPF